MMTPSTALSFTSSSSSAPLRRVSLLKGTLSGNETRLGPEKQNQRPQPLPVASGGGLGRPSPPAALHGMPKKPMRPLTAYHIFFQIEREYVIQTMAGEDADKSIHDKKVFMNDVPRRYRAIRLLPDWYAGPGKRQKRKHRKQHGKIGFLELSRVISTRWAQLEKIDPETKTYVRRIAKQELDEYYREMKAYKEATSGMSLESAHKTVTKKRPCSQISPFMLHQQRQQQMSSNALLVPEMVSSHCQTMQPIRPSSLLNPSTAQLRRDINELMALIDNKSQHMLPSSFGSVEEPLQVGSMSSLFMGKMNSFQRQDSAPMIMQSFGSLSGEAGAAERPVKQARTVSGAACASHSATEVDLCDDEIMQLWTTNN